MTALLLFVLGFKLFIFDIIHTFLDKFGEGRTGKWMYTDGVWGGEGGGGGYDLICTSCLVVSGIVPKTVDLLPNSCDRI